MYSSSFGKSIQASAKKRDNQNVGYTGPIKQALPPSFKTLYASLMPRYGSGQYSILRRWRYVIPIRNHEEKLPHPNLNNNASRMYFSWKFTIFLLLKPHNETPKLMLCTFLGAYPKASTTSINILDSSETR
jgi:hypothetical protein